MKRSLYETARRRIEHAWSPFQQEGGAVSGDTRRSQAVRIFPW